MMGARIGRNVTVRGGFQVLDGFDITIGQDSFINSHCSFDASASIVIGRNVCISYDVTIVTGTHEIGPHAQRTGAFQTKSVVIEDGAWIGARTVILPGVTIGAGAVIGAGSLVTKSIPSDCVAFGAPAKVVRELEPS